MLGEFLSPRWECIEGTAEILGTAHTLGNLSWHERSLLIDGRAVQLAVPEPIFIESGDIVRVVGVAASSGVLEALAYTNRSKGVSGKQRGAWGEFVAAVALVAVAVVSIELTMRQLALSLSRLSAATLIACSVGIGLVVIVLIALVLVTARRAWLRQSAVGNALGPVRQVCATDSNRRA